MRPKIIISTFETMMRLIISKSETIIQMGASMKILTRQEELILLTVHQLGNESHLINIRQYLIDNTSRDWSVSSVYVPLDRLTNEGYLNERIGDPIGKRGRRAVKYYNLSEDGKKSLTSLKELTNKFWEGLEGIIA